MATNSDKLIVTVSIETTICNAMKAFANELMRDQRIKLESVFIQWDETAFDRRPRAESVTVQITSESTR